MGRPALHEAHRVSDSEIRCQAPQASLHRPPADQDRPRPRQQLPEASERFQEARVTLLGAHARDDGDGRLSRRHRDGNEPLQIDSVVNHPNGGGEPLASSPRCQLPRVRDHDVRSSVRRCSQRPPDRMILEAWAAATTGRDDRISPGAAAAARTCDTPRCAWITSTGEDRTDSRMAEMVEANEPTRSHPASIGPTTSTGNGADRASTPG